MNLIFWENFWDFLIFVLIEFWFEKSWIYMVYKEFIWILTQKLRIYLNFSDCAKQETFQ